MIKLLIWLSLLGFVVFNAAMVLQAFYTNWKVTACFESLVDHPAASTLEPRAQLDRLFSLQYIQHDDLPDEFYEQLQINSTGHIMEVSSSYHLTIFPFGQVQDAGEPGVHDSQALGGLDALRNATRIELFFEPYAITRVEGP